MPRVSVIIPSYNHEEFVSVAIQSVLSQTYQDFELIITDDGSTDGTVSKIREFSDPRLKLFVFDKNTGACGAANNCLKEARGEYVAMLSSDDVFFPEKLQKQVNFLDAHPDVGAVFSYALIIAQNGKPFSDDRHFYAKIFFQPNRTRYEWLNYFFYKGNCLCHPSMLIRKTCYDEVGYYDPRYGQLPDLDFWIRLCMSYDIHILPEPLVNFRILKQEANASGNRPEARIRTAWELAHILENYLNIDQYDELVKVFPNLRDYSYKNIDPQILPFLLVKLAIEVDSPPHRYFAIDLFHRFLARHQMITGGERSLKFNFTDLIHLTGEHDVFHIIGREKLSVLNRSHGWKTLMIYYRIKETVLQNFRLFLKSIENMFKK